MSWKKIVHKTYTVEIEAPELYVDNQARKRSGHMSHALAEFAPGCFIDFNSNCSPVRLQGHSAYGWIEYRISRDSGKSYSEVYKLPYAEQCFIDGIYVISVEKAVACDDGTIVAFCLRNDAIDPTCMEPWHTPTVVTSADEGKSWTEAVEYSPYDGRTYDALYHDGVIYALHKCDKNFIGSKPEHVYRLYVSLDNGKSFEERSILPIDGIGRGYGAMIFDADGRLHAYSYNVNAESQMDHAVSDDGGFTWTLCEPCYLALGIRNPQIACIDGVYILHGRSSGLPGIPIGNKGFVFYTSENGSDWDEGSFVVDRMAIPAFYSNNLNLRDEDGNFLLVQYSESYDGPRVNVKHLKLRIVR